jgi:hypothetical protein
MARIAIGDDVQVMMPKGLSKRGVPGVNVMYATWIESRYEGAKGRVVDFNPHGTHHIPLYLVDFRAADNSRLGLPTQSYWFRENWLEPEALPVRETVTA